MNCKKCNYELSNEDKFCPVCGEVAKSDSSVNQKVSFITKIKNLSKIKKALIFGIIIIVILAIVISNIWFPRGYDNCEDLVDAIAMSIQNNDTSKINSTIYEGEWDYYKDTSVYKLYSVLEMGGAPSIEEVMIGAKRRDYNLTPDEDIKIKYNITNISEATSDSKDKVKEMLSEYCDVDSTDIQSIVKVKFDVKYTKKKGSGFDTDSILAAQIEDKWYYIILE